jgi:tRNA A37 threonylcarbamoyladenosine synthetase subunit TsaC/SUA5/YrdC
LIHERYEHIVDVVINGGYGELEPSTIVDCTGDEPVIVRQGKGILEF